MFPPYELSITTIYSMLSLPNQNTITINSNLLLNNKNIHMCIKDINVQENNNSKQHEQ